MRPSYEQALRETQEILILVATNLRNALGQSLEPFEIASYEASLKMARQRVRQNMQLLRKRPDSVGNPGSKMG